MKLINFIYTNAKRNIIKVDSYQSLRKSQASCWGRNRNQRSCWSCWRCI